MKLLKYDSFEVSERMPWKGYESAMNLPWWNQYECDIDHFEALEKVPWICHESDRKVPGNSYEYVNLFIYNNSWRLRESAMNLSWKRHESAMNLPWWNQYEYDIDHFEALEKATWKRHAMNLPWKCHESDMNTILKP